MQKSHQPGVLEIDDWIAKHLSNKRIGGDPSLLQAAKIETWSQKWSTSGITFTPLSENLIDPIWAGERPSRSAAPLRVQPLSLAGESVASKLERVREAIREGGGQSLLVNALDQVAWITNLRGGDIDCNPVFFAYLAITLEEARLFVQLEALGPENRHLLKEHLQEANVSLHEYQDFFSVARAMSLGACMLEKSTCTLAMKSSCLSGDGGEALMMEASPVEIFKARKNEAELRGIREVNRRTHSCTP